MWLAYSSALPNKPSFWTGSSLANIWVFALKLFVCGSAIIILKRAKVWPWDGGILTSSVIFREIGPFEDMKYHFSKLLVLILGSLAFLPGHAASSLHYLVLLASPGFPSAFILYTCMYSGPPVPSHVYTCMHRHTDTYAWKYAHTHKHMLTHTHVHMHIYTHKHT